MPKVLLFFSGKKRVTHVVLAKIEGEIRGSLQLVAGVRKIATIIFPLPTVTVWPAWKWDGELRQMCLLPDPSASYFWSGVWNRCGLSTTVFIGQSLHWCVSPRVRLLRTRGSGVSHRPRDSQEEWESLRSLSRIFSSPSFWRVKKNSLKNSHLIAVQGMKRFWFLGS